MPLFGCDERPLLKPGGHLSETPVLTDGKDTTRQVNMTISPREGCRRRTIASRDRRHSSARCSCRVVPPIRDVRFVDLNLAVFMCNSGRAAPGTGLQSPETGSQNRCDRDRTSRIWTREMPANCRQFPQRPRNVGSHRTAWWAWCGRVASPLLTTERLLVRISIETHKTSPEFDQTAADKAKNRIKQALGDIGCDVFIETDR
jgi:hypothetical protein